MRFNFRKRLRFGPLFWTFSTKGLTSWGIKVWRYTFNAKTGRHTFDSPGPGSWSWGGSRRRSR